MNSNIKNLIRVGSVFRHYKKNQLYLVESIALNTETLQEMVVYKQMYPSDSSKFDRFQRWVRPKDMFNGTVEVRGKEIQRFTHVGKY
jgi:hypothetical protein